MFPAKPFPKLERLLRTRPSSRGRERRVQVIRLQKAMSFEPIQMQGPKKEQSRIDLIVSKGPNSFEMPNSRG